MVALLFYLNMATTSLAVNVPTALSALEQHQRDLYQRVAPCVVYIAANGGSGSGFFVSADGVILTNAHVVGKAKSVDVVLRDGKKLVGKVVEMAQQDVDLAVVKVDIKDAAFLPIVGGSQPGPGDFVASVGHGEGAVWSFNTGMISNAYVAHNKQRVLQTQIPLNPGNSGGPLVDASGRVIGVVTAGIHGANAINFAIPIELGPKVLTSLSPLCACLRVRAPADAAIFVDGVAVAKGPLLNLLPDGDSHEVFAIIKGKMHKSSYSGMQTRTIDLNAH